MSISEKILHPASQVFRQIATDPDWTFKIGIGCLINGAAFGLLLINLMLLPLCFCLWSLTAGYILMTVSAIVKEPECKLPTWQNLLELLIGGGIWLTVSVSHFLIPLLAGFASLFLAESMGLDNCLKTCFLPWAISTWSVMIILAAVIAFFSTYLMINFAVKQSIFAAFNIKDIASQLKRRPGALIQAWLLQAGLIYLAILVPIATVVGILIIPSTLFCAQLIGSSILAHAWRDEVT